MKKEALLWITDISFQKKVWEYCKDGFTIPEK